nr:FhaA domain-containing protein [uncultured Anaeromusa sp.]
MRRFESFLETGIEGFFNRKLASQLQPAELLLALVKRLEEEQAQGFLLEEVQIQVSQEDYEQLQKPKKPMAEGVEAWLSRRFLEEAVERGLEAQRDMPIFLESAESLSSGMFKLVVQKSAQAENREEEGCTRVFQTLSGASLLAPGKSSSLLASLCIHEGPGVGKRFLCADGRVNMGRREQNEIPLEDRNASRLHAYVQWEDKRHILYDAKSLNGTFVNGHRIMRQVLEPDDLVRIGHTVLRYEVENNDR